MTHSRTQADPKLPPGSQFCRCAACGEYFNSEYSFRLHRAGKPDDRRCRTIQEMQDRGMSVSGRGYWVSKARE